MDRGKRAKGRRKRVCTYCGLLTEEEYSDGEWTGAGRMCEECYTIDLAEDITE